MDLKELHDFKLSDALYFHTDLNQAIFDGDHMNDEVRQQLLIIADDFIEHLGIDDLDVKDITLSGSNAAYSYTKHSDIDLHILVDMTGFTDDDVYRELFDAKKIVYNDQHDIVINGYEVELYVQDANEPVISLGEYSILNNKWIKLPRKRKANLDQVAAKAKFKKIAKLAEFALRSNSYEKIQGVLKTIKKYRQAGLDLNGEFGPENLAFKALRTQGIIKRLYEKLDELHSERLSLPENKVIRKVKRNDLADSLANEFTRFKTEEDYDPNGPPPGPETKPTMPAGTVKVDVSDVYDWYKLGQHISNLKGLGKHDFGKGPPSTIMAFGSEEEEHKYIDALKKTGLTTTDIDPVDPNQPKSIPRQKTDPTYNVNEVFDQPYKTKSEKSEYGDVDMLAKLPDGSNLSIMFSRADIVDEIWGVEFYRNNSQEVTGEGDAQRIFATVLAAIQKFIKKYQPQTLFFTASKKPEADMVQYGANANPESRANLYDRLVQRYAKELGYRAFRADTGTIVRYELSKINQEVTEEPLEELANSSLKVKEPKDLVNTNDRKQVTYKVMKFKSGKNKFLINFTVKGAPAFGKKSNWNAVNVAFGVREEQDDYSFGDEMNTDLTAKNKNQFLIYSTVINAIRKFITEYNTEIDEIIIQGAGKRQLMMYQRFFRVAPKYFPGWHYNGEHSLVRDIPRQQVKKEDVSEASGYIPSEKEKNDPRFKTALTVDVKPDTIKKNAKAFNFKVSRAGIPPLLRK